MSHYWSSSDGFMPPDMPKCGFDGGLCDYTTVYMIIGILIFFGGKTMTKEWNCFNISLYFSGYSPWLFALYKGVSLGE